jgi:hypothetical protein
MLLTLVFALGMMAQTATPAAPAAGETTKTCACCAHDMANMKPGDKCPMMAQKDGKKGDPTSCCGKETGCCKDGKCDMQAHKDGTTADAKSCCTGDKCSMMAKGNKGDRGCCCASMEAQQHSGM